MNEIKQAFEEYKEHYQWVDEEDFDFEDFKAGFCAGLLAAGKPDIPIPEGGR